MALLWKGIRSAVSQKTAMVSEFFRQKMKEREIRNATISVRRMFCWNKRDLSQGPKPYINDAIIKRKYNMDERVTFYLKDLPHADTLLEVHYEFLENQYSVIYESMTIVFPPIDVIENMGKISNHSLTKSVYTYAFFHLGEICATDSDVTEWVQRYEGKFHAFHGNYSTVSVQQILQLIYVLCSCDPEDPERAFQVHFGEDPNQSDITCLLTQKGKTESNEQKEELSDESARISKTGVLKTDLFSGRVTTCSKI